MHFCGFTTIDIKILTLQCANTIYKNFDPKLSSPGPFKVVFSCDIILNHRAHYISVVYINSNKGIHTEPLMWSQIRHH